MAEQTTRNSHDDRVDGRSPEDIAVALAHNIVELDQGSAAALRRGPLAGAGVAAFWKLIAEQGISARHTEAWATVMQAIAILTPVGRGERGGAKTPAHDPERPMGSVLCAAGLSEVRLARLLGAKGSMRGEQLVRLCRRLSRSVEHRRFDLRTLARFIVRGDTYTDRRIAGDYYREEAKLEAKQTQTKEQ